MRTRRRLFAVTVVCAMVLLTSCGAPGSPTASGTSSPQSTDSLAPTPASTPPPSTTAAPTASELVRVAGLVYPACTASTCAGSAMFTTCDAASAEQTDVFAPCPFTASLEIQLRDDVAESVSAPDPLGGGQDPEWTVERFAAEPSPTGGVVHVTLGTGTATEKLDLVMAVEGSDLLVNDIYCTGADPEGSDALASGWLARSTCAA